MTGGTGNDTYIVSQPTDLVIEAAGGGVDIVKTFQTYALPDHVEHLTLLGSANREATGNALDNVLSGNSGRNGLFGGAGSDRLDGGNHNDRLNGGSGADRLRGEGDDLILLDSAADFAAGEIIDGGAGSNELRYLGTTAATLTLTANVTNIHSIRLSTVNGDSSGNAAINVDASAVTSNGIDFDGHDGNNVFTGTRHVDLIFSGFGDDTLTGGAADDILIGNAGADVFLIGAGAHHGADEHIDGGDSVNVIRFTSTLSNDTLELSSHVFNIAEVEIGNAAGANGGTRALNVDASAVTGALEISGNAGANRLTGTGGADVIIGRGGADTLTGGAGGDTFRYMGRPDSGLSGMDTVTDFGEGDTLDFTGMAEASA